MGWSSPDGWPTRLLSGDPIAILVALVISMSLPVLLHMFLYRAAKRLPTTPTFLLLGPSSSGKTSLVTLLQRQSLSPNTPPSPSSTHTSQAPTAVHLILPSSIPLGSNRYRSSNDTSVLAAQSTNNPYILHDTPGHGKLRSTVSLTPSIIANPSLTGILFIIDAANLDDQNTLNDTAGYLHDTLLTLIRRRRIKTLPKPARNKKINVLIAANKQDLFTALPAGAVRQRLEQEIQRLKDSRRRGVIGVDDKGLDPTAEEDEDILGGGSEEKFSFKMLEDEDNGGLSVEVLPGSVRGEEAGKGVRRWEEWIGNCL